MKSAFQLQELTADYADIADGEMRSRNRHFFLHPRHPRNPRFKVRAWILYVHAVLRATRDSGFALIFLRLYPE